EPGRDGAVELLFEKVSKLARGTLGGFECNIPSKALGHDHVSRPLADVIALDEADVSKLRPLRFAQHLAGAANLLQSFHLFNPDIEQADAWSFDAEENPRHRAPHGREVDEVARVGSDRSPKIEHD